MTSAMERRWMTLILVLAGSGLGCQETRFLSCRTRDPRVEARSYDLHDPFPDESIGPETFSRPRAFEEPRTDERKTFELRNLQASRGVISPAHAAYWDPLGTNAAAAMPVQPIWRQVPAGVPIATQPGMWDDTAPRYNVVPH
jgi:hypothetical protein